MMAFWDLYVSGFWVWMGMTIGLSIILKWSVILVVGVATGLGGGNVVIGSNE